MKMSFYSHANKTHFQSRKILQACVAKWLMPRTPYLDVQVQVSPVTLFLFGKELYSTLCLFTQVYKLMGTGDIAL